MNTKYYVVVGSISTVMVFRDIHGRGVFKGADVHEIGPFDSRNEAEAYVYDRYFDSFWIRIVDTP